MVDQRLRPICVKAYGVILRLRREGPTTSPTGKEREGYPSSSSTTYSQDGGALVLSYPEERRRNDIAGGRPLLFPKKK